VNHRQLELVRSSYDRIRRVRPLFADLFNRRLVLIAPVLDRLLPADPAQRDDAFIEMMEEVIAGLDRLDVLLPTLVVLAGEWRRLGVEPADYDIAGMALGWTVEQVLPGSPGAIAAWRETFDLLAGVMKRAAAEARLPALQVVPRRQAHTDPYGWSVHPPPRSERSERIGPRSRRPSQVPTLVPPSLPPPRSGDTVPPP
jgi:hypothetical protein